MRHYSRSEFDVMYRHKLPPIIIQYHGVDTELEAGFGPWLAKQKLLGSYEFKSRMSCAFAQYLNSLGHHDANVRFSTYSFGAHHYIMSEGLRNTLSRCVIEHFGALRIYHNWQRKHNPAAFLSA